MIFYHLERLTDDEAAAIGAQLSVVTAEAASRQAASESIVEFLSQSLIASGTGEPACVLARCFQTSIYARMPLHYRDAADELLHAVSARPKALEQMRCLALLATRGIRSVWNDVLTSVAHQAIPLPSVEVVQKAPMIARLLDQLGMAIEQAVAPPDSTEFLIEGQSVFRTFHIANAVGSPFIPAQDSFVEPYGVSSVIGMGGVLPDGELLAVILFSRVPVTQATAKRFSVIGASVREILLRFPTEQTFERDGE